MNSSSPPSLFFLILFLPFHLLYLKAEYDSMVLECAGSVIAPIASVVGGEVFLPWLGPLLPSIIGRLVCDCVHCT